MTPEQRSLRAKLAAHRMHSQYDSKEITTPARVAWFRRFEDQVDPERKLPAAERQRRAQHAMKSHMYGLALKSARARRRA